MVLLVAHLLMLLVTILGTRELRRGDQERERQGGCELHSGLLAWGAVGDGGWEGGKA